MPRGYQTKANDCRVGAIARRSKAFTPNRFSGFQKLIVHRFGSTKTIKAVLNIDQRYMTLHVPNYIINRPIKYNNIICVNILVCIHARTIQLLTERKLNV